jgi:hypothetical protein
MNLITLYKLTLCMFLLISVIISCPLTVYSVTFVVVSTELITVFSHFCYKYPLLYHYPQLWSKIATLLEGLNIISCH